MRYGTCFSHEMHITNQKLSRRYCNHMQSMSNAPGHCHIESPAAHAVYVHHRGSSRQQYLHNVPVAAPCRSVQYWGASARTHVRDDFVTQNILWERDRSPTPASGRPLHRGDTAQLEGFQIRQPRGYRYSLESAEQHTLQLILKCTHLES